MKYLLVKLVLGSFLVSLLTGSAAAQTRIGTVDLRKVFDNYWKTKQADASLKERGAEMEKDHKVMVDNFKKGRDAYQKLLTDAADQAVSAEEREKRKKAAEDKLKELKDSEETIATYERQARTTIDEQRKRMRDNILTEIRNVLNAKAKAAGYSMVLDTAAESANNTPIMLYVAENKDNDLTDSTLSQLNAGAPVDLQKGEEKKDEKKEEKKDGKK
jgi:outer membrane protein